MKRNQSSETVSATFGATEKEPLVVRFPDNQLLPILFGDHDRHLARIEQTLNIQISSRGNRVSLKGPFPETKFAAGVLKELYKRLQNNLPVDVAEVDAAIRMAGNSQKINEDVSPDKREEISIRTPKRHLTGRSPCQVTYIKALATQQMIFGIGPAGTGKTYLAVATAAEMLISGQVDRIILSRPAVEAGEHLGFLPGSLQEKIDPYLAPLYDALYDILPADQVAKRLNSGEIEVVPLAFMRGRTLSHAFVILDEAQNATKIQMKMFLTRLGEGSRMAITGDPSQVDLPNGSASGLDHAVKLLEQIQDVRVVKFTNLDVLRHKLVTQIVQAYDTDDDRNRNKK